jgi:hypothetical protein
MEKQMKDELSVVRVNKEEYELSDGSIHSFMFELDESPVLEDFQKIYEKSKNDLTKMMKELENLE